MKNGYWISYSNKKGTKNYQDYYNDLIGHIGEISWISKNIDSLKYTMDNNDAYYEIMVYYSVDENGNAIPSLMMQLSEDGDICNIKGRGSGYIEDNSLIAILKSKIQNMAMREEIMTKIQDLSLLVSIEQKVSAKEELTKEELIFIYEIERAINSVGYDYREKDPRITRIKQSRNVKKDMAKLFDCLEEQVGTTPEDLNKDLVVYYGDIKDNNYGLEDYHFPKIVIGNITSSIEYAMNVEFPHAIIGSLSLPNLQSIANVTFPEKCNFIELPTLSDIITPTVIPFDHIAVNFPINKVSNLIAPERISENFISHNYDCAQYCAIQVFAQINGIEIYYERSRK